MLKTIASILLTAAGKFIYGIALLIALIVTAAFLWPFALIPLKR